MGREGEVFAFAGSACGAVPALLCCAHGAPCEATFLLSMFSLQAAYHAARLSERASGGALSTLEVTDASASICVVAYCTLEMTLNALNAYRVALVAGLVGASCGYSVVMAVLPREAARRVPEDLTFPFAALCLALLLAVKCCRTRRAPPDAFPLVTSVLIESCIVAGAMWLQWGHEYGAGVAHGGWHLILACCVTAVVRSRRCRALARRKKCALVSCREVAAGEDGGGAQAAAL